MKTVAILPVDDRPVNYDYPRYLGRAAGFDILLPPREWLGNPWRAAQHTKLVSWVTEAAVAADALIVSIDTLAYGGLIPSRKSAEPAETVLARLDVLRALKAARPELPVLASSVILRIHRSNSAEEERPYWAIYGRRMFRLSFLEHKGELGAASAEERGERDALRAEIPDEIYSDYRSARARNHAINRAMLDLAADGVLDYLLLPQDDTADFGWNIAEARSLQESIRKRELTDRAITYPGADEIGCLLLARVACRAAGFAPRVRPHFSPAVGAAVVTDYEDRPLRELLAAHLAPLGGAIVESPGASALDLWFNAPECKQGNSESQWLLRHDIGTVRAGLPPEFRTWLDTVVSSDGFRATQREMESPERKPENTVRPVLTALKDGRSVALADVAFVNAADAGVCELLCSHPEIVSLASFAGWNTAGNTLGTALAQAVIRMIALRDGESSSRLAAHLEFLFLRFIDDHLYQACERTRCMVEDLPSLGIAPTMERLPEDKVEIVETRVRASMLASISRLRDVFVASGLVREVRVTNIHLPWRRLFEVGFDVHIDLV